MCRSSSSGWLHSRLSGNGFKRGLKGKWNYEYPVESLAYVCLCLCVRLCLCLSVNGLLCPSHDWTGILGWYIYSVFLRRHLYISLISHPNSIFMFTRVMRLSLGKVFKFRNKWTFLFDPHGSTKENCPWLHILTPQFDIWRTVEKKIWSRRQKSWPGIDDLVSTLSDCFLL